MGVAVLASENVAPARRDRGSGWHDSSAIWLGSRPAGRLRRGADAQPKAFPLRLRHARGPRRAGRKRTLHRRDALARWCCLVSDLCAFSRTRHWMRSLGLSGGPADAREEALRARLAGGLERRPRKSRRQRSPTFWRGGGVSPLSASRVRESAILARGYTARSPHRESGGFTHSARRTTDLRWTQPASDAQCPLAWRPPRRPAATHT